MIWINLLYHNLLFAFPYFIFLLLKVSQEERISVSLVSFLLFKATVSLGIKVLQWKSTNFLLDPRNTVHIHVYLSKDKTPFPIKVYFLIFCNGTRKLYTALHILLASPLLSATICNCRGSKAATLPCRIILLPIFSPTSPPHQVPAHWRVTSLPGHFDTSGFIFVCQARLQSAAGVRVQILPWKNKRRF